MMFPFHPLMTALTLSALLPWTISETIHSVLVFSRHGDRTAKFYKGYHMTNLGAEQVFSSGQFYRDRYIEDGASTQIAGISPDKALQGQLWASAPDQLVLYHTATNFLQGLYPPLVDLNQTAAAEELTNGTATESPLGGYQFILIHGEGETDPDTIWIKGDDECPNYDKAYKSYSKSPEYLSTLEATNAFYSQFEPLLGSIIGAENVTYKEAYNVFDLLNVASIHNASVAPKIQADDLDQLRYLANEWEWNHNYNATQPDRSIGGMALAGGIMRQIQDVVAGKAKLKFNLMAGSYDTFMAFFGLTNLTAASDDFMGLPNYAASMAFELFSRGDDEKFPDDVEGDLMVRFLFRNGTNSDQPLESFPMFGGREMTMTYGDFVKTLGARSIMSVDQWCGKCASEVGFCAAANAAAQDKGDSASEVGKGSGSGLSNAAAGGIGAGVTIAVIALFGLLFWVLRGRKGKAHKGTNSTRPQVEKRTSETESDRV